MREFQGYEMRFELGGVHRHVAFDGVPMIISFGPALRLVGPEGPDAGEERTSFVAGLGDTYSDSEYPARSHGIQVNFTPIGAYLFLGLPMHTLANRILDLGEVLGPEAVLLTEQLYESDDWDARFRTLERFIAARIAEARPPSGPVVFAYGRLRETGGSAQIGGLAEATGWSSKHLIERFREEVGLPPKTVARILRFQRALRTFERNPIRRTGRRSRAEAGYYDQAHLIRDFKEFAGSTPSEYAARLLPEGGGLRAE